MPISSICIIIALCLPFLTACSSLTYNIYNLHPTAPVKSSIFYNDVKLTVNSEIELDTIRMDTANTYDFITDFRAFRDLVEGQNVISNKKTLRTELLQCGLSIIDYQNIEINNLIYYPVSRSPATGSTGDITTTWIFRIYLKADRFDIRYITFKVNWIINTPKTATPSFKLFPRQWQMSFAQNLHYEYVAMNHKGFLANKTTYTTNPVPVAGGTYYRIGFETSETQYFYLTSNSGIFDAAGNESIKPYTQFSGTTQNLTNGIIGVDITLDQAPASLVNHSSKLLLKNVGYVYNGSAWVGPIPYSTMISQWFDRGAEINYENYPDALATVVPDYSFLKNPTPALGLLGYCPINPLYDGWIANHPDFVLPTTFNDQNITNVANAAVNVNFLILRSLYNTYLNFAYYLSMSGVPISKLGLDVTEISEYQAGHIDSNAALFVGGKFRYGHNLHIVAKIYYLNGENEEIYLEDKIDSIHGFWFAGISANVFRDISDLFKRNYIDRGNTGINPYNATNGNLPLIYLGEIDPTGKDNNSPTKKYFHYQRSGAGVTNPSVFDRSTLILIPFEDDIAIAYDTSNPTHFSSLTKKYRFPNNPNLNNI